MLGWLRSFATPDYGSLSSSTIMLRLTCMSSATELRRSSWERKKEEVRVVDAERMKTGVLRKAKRIVADRRDELMVKWVEFHG